MKFFELVWYKVILNPIYIFYFCVWTMTLLLSTSHFAVLLLVHYWGRIKKWHLFICHFLLLLLSKLGQCQPEELQVEEENQWKIRFPFQLTLCCSIIQVPHFFPQMVIVLDLQICGGYCKLTLFCLHFSPFTCMIMIFCMWMVTPIPLYSNQSQLLYINVPNHLFSMKDQYKLEWIVLVTLKGWFEWGLREI